MIIKPCRFDKSESLAQFQPANDPNEALSKLSEVYQEKILVKLTNRIAELIEEDTSLNKASLWRTEDFLQLYRKLESGFVEMAQWMGFGDTNEAMLFQQNLDNSCFENISLHLRIAKTEIKKLLGEIIRIKEAVEKKSEIDSETIREYTSVSDKLCDKIETFLNAKENILLKQSSSVVDAKSLPIALRKVVIRNYYDLQDLELELSGSAQWVFLTGENGFGKTLLLRAITIALNGNWVEGWEGENIAPVNFNAGIELLDDHSIQLHNFENKFFSPFKKFAAYGPSRLAVQSLDVDATVRGKSSQTYSLFNNDGVLLNIERKLMILHKLSLEQGPEQQSAIDQLTVVKNTLLKLLSPYIVEIDTTGSNVSYQERGGEDKRPLKLLASGVQSIIALVGDILIRLTGDNKTIRKTEDLKGVVIIDEIDLHLHPKWQKELPVRLSEVFPNVQFIASTHSPIPLLGSAQNSLFLSVRKNDRNKIEVDRLEVPEIIRLQPNIILSSPIFDLDDIFHVNRKSIDVVETEDSWKEMKLDRKRKQYLLRKQSERKQRLQRSSKKEVFLKS